MSMPKWIDPKITVGNLVTIAVMVVSFFIWGAKLEAKVDRQDATIAELKSTDARVAVQLENARSLAVTRDLDVSSRLARIEAILERLERRTQP